MQRGERESRKRNSHLKECITRGKSEVVNHTWRLFQEKYEKNNKAQMRVTFTHTKERSGGIKFCKGKCKEMRKKVEHKIEHLEVNFWWGCSAVCV